MSVVEERTMRLHNTKKGSWVLLADDHPAVREALALGTGR
jgi:hypothetical protein